MDIGEFFKPTFFKVNLALVLLVLVGYILWPLITWATGGDAISFGFPMATRTLDISAAAAETPIDFNNLGRPSLVGAIVDVVFWYGLSCTYVQRFGEWKSEE